MSSRRSQRCNPEGVWDFHRDTRALKKYGNEKKSKKLLLWSGMVEQCACPFSLKKNQQKLKNFFNLCAPRRSYRSNFSQRRSSTKGLCQLYLWPLSFYLFFLTSAADSRRWHVLVFRHHFDCFARSNAPNSDVSRGFRSFFARFATFSQLSPRQRCRKIATARRLPVLWSIQSKNTSTVFF